MLVRRVSAMLAGFLVAMGVAGTAFATPTLTLDRNAPLSFTFVDSEFCPGIDVITTFEGKRSATIFFDADGAERRLVIDVQYWGTFTNAADPDLTVQSPGYRHITFDFAAGTYTDVGVYRSVSVAGSGNVLLQAGRWVETLDEAILQAVSGPHEDWLGDTAAFCDALGG